MAISINFRDLLPELAISNRDRKEIIRTITDAMQQNYESLDAEIDGLLLITDVDASDESFLDYTAAMLGLELLGLDTAEQKRTLIRNAVAIFKQKGTENSWDIIFRALGFDTDITELWWDDTGTLVSVDPMFGQLEAGLDPVNPEITLLGRYTVAEFNDPASNPLGRLDAATIAALLSPNDEDTYEVEDTGTINPGAVVVEFNQLIKWDGTGGVWTKLDHYRTIEDLTSDLSRPQPFTGDMADVTIRDITTPGIIPTITVRAGSVGVWGNDIEIEIEDGTDPLLQFNLIVNFQSTEVARFDDLSKDLTQSIDTIEAFVNTETFYIDIESIGTFGTELRPASGVYPLGQANPPEVVSFTVGAPPKNTKSPYVDVILSVDFLDLVSAETLNKAAFFDGRVKEVKPAHIRIRFKRIAATITEDADLLYDDDGLTVDIFAEIVDVLQPSCDPPVGAIVIYFHNGFIRSRSGTFSRGYSIEFPDGIPDDPGSAGGGAGYVYAYDALDVGGSGLTYGDLEDSIFNPFIYGFTFDDNVCAVDSLEALVNNDAGPFVDDDFYGVSQSARITYNGAMKFDGFMPFNSSPIDPATVDGDPNDNPDPQSGVSFVRCDPTTDKCVVVRDWKYSEDDSDL
jgi:phage tail-like protein